MKSATTLTLDTDIIIAAKSTYPNFSQKVNELLRADLDLPVLHAENLEGKMKAALSMYKQYQKELLKEKQKQQEEEQAMVWE